jgi:preprotein translocase subunit SecE
VSDERDSAGSAGTGEDNGDGQTAVVTRPPRPTGKRSRRRVAGEDGGEAVDLATGTKASPTKNGEGGGKKTAKDGEGPSRNPFAYVWTYLSQVVAELRKVIWPNRKQMVNYTIVVLFFLAFMVTLIALVDMGLVRLISMLLG